MKKLKILIIMLLFPLVLCAQQDNVTSEETVETKCPDHLFYIAKSDNANILYYDVKIKKDQIYDYDPVKIYWIMYAKSGGTETMSFAERPQFDLIIKTLDVGKKYQLNFKNKQLSNKNIFLELLPNGCAQANVDLNGEMCLLTDVFVHIDPKSGIIPDVLSLDINGINAKGEKITEEFKVK